MAEVRIPRVRDALEDEYDRSAIDHQPEPPYTTPLRCAGCGIPVFARRSNAQATHGKGAHYRKKPGSNHTDRCRFDLDRRGKALVDDSGTVVRRAGQWRLNCPPAPERRTTPQGAPPAHRRNPRSNGPLVSKLNGQAIASARRIAEILNDFDHDPEAAAHFAATTPDGHTHIPWNEFAYRHTTAHELAQQLLDGTARPIPHAVWGPASHVGEASTGTSHFVRYIAQQPVTLDGRKLKLAVALRSNHPEWIAAHTRSGLWLGYGHWQLYPRSLDDIRRDGRLELQLWVNEPWQATRWNTDPHAAPPPPPTPAPRPAPRARPTAAHSTRPAPARPAPPATPAPSPRPASTPPPAEKPKAGQERTRPENAALPPLPPLPPWPPMPSTAPAADRPHQDPPDEMAETSSPTSEAPTTPDRPRTFLRRLTTALRRRRKKPEGT